MDALDVSRVERKYVLTAGVAENLYGKLRKLLPGDEFQGFNPYVVRSLYFDSYDNEDYFEKLAGVKDRKKIRLRIYDPKASVIKLEIKQKEGENQRKISFSVTKEQALDLMAGKIDFLEALDNPLGSDLYYTFLKESYRPKCIVEYKRRAFSVPVNHTRITFDSEIRSSEGCLDLFADHPSFLYPVGSRSEVVLEVKYDHFLLSYIKDALDMCEKTEQSFSKYITARPYGLG